jgi:indole-3-glycerol phosphate synthase
VSTYLDEIVAHHRDQAEADPRDADKLWEQALSAPGPIDPLPYLASQPTTVIAEIKRRSPSAGSLNESIDPQKLAAQYENGGASAISVLTDEKYFGGSLEDLRQIKMTVSLPLLRKDFIVSRNQIADARIAGASLVLLIVAALSPAELLTLHKAARDLGMISLVEAHDENEVEIALGSGATCVAINQRNLHNFEVDSSVAVTLGPLLEGVVSVAESGLKSADDVARMRESGYNAVLVGEALVTSPEPEKLLAEMVAAGAE